MDIKKPHNYVKLLDLVAKSIELSNLNEFVSDFLKVVEFF
jgi:hypothetical protein